MALAYGFIKTNVRDVLGDKDFTNFPYVQDYFANKQGLPLLDPEAYAKLTDTQRAALATFSSFIPGQSYAEGIGGLAQLYVNGWMDFMNAVGPFTDGNGYDSSYVYNADYKTLTIKYPKAQALYDLYKAMFFGNQEFLPQLVREIREGTLADQQEMRSLRDAYFSHIELTYNVDIVNNLSEPLTTDNSLALADSMALFPQDFYSAGNGKLKIVLVDDNRPSFDSKPITTIYIPRLVFSNNNISDYIAYDLFLRKDAADNYRTSNEIVRILGGDKFLNNPGELYPKLYAIEAKQFYKLYNYLGSLFEMKKKTDPPQKLYPEGVSVGLARLYIEGWENFSQIGVFFDPKVDFKAGTGPDDYKGTRTYQLYQVLKQAYGGREYGIDGNGEIHIIIPDA